LRVARRCARGVMKDINVGSAMFTLTDMATQSSRYKSNDNNHRDLKPTTLEISNVQVRAARENRGLERERAMGPTIWIVARRKTDRRRRARSASQERAMTRAKALVGRNAVKSTTRSYAAATNEGGGAGEPDGRGARARTKCRNGALCAAVRGLRFAADGANEFGYAGGGQSIGQRDIGVGFDVVGAAPLVAVLKQPSREHGLSGLLEPLVHQRGDLVAEIGGGIQARKFEALQRGRRGVPEIVPRGVELLLGHGSRLLVLFR